MKNVINVMRLERVEDKIYFYASIKNTIKEFVVDKDNKFYLVKSNNALLSFEYLSKHNKSIINTISLLFSSKIHDRLMCIKDDEVITLL